MMDCDHLSRVSSSIWLGNNGVSGLGLNLELESKSNAKLTADKSTRNPPNIP